MSKAFLLFICVFISTLPAYAYPENGKNKAKIQKELARFRLCLQTETVDKVKDKFGDDSFMICGADLGNVTLTHDGIREIEICLNDTPFSIKKNRLEFESYDVVYRCKKINSIELLVSKVGTNFFVKTINFVYQ